VRIGVPQAEGVLGQTPSVVQAAAGYSASFVLRIYRMGDQFGPCAGTGPSAEANILCEQSIAEARGKIPGPKEGGPGCGVLNKETSPLLPELYCSGDDRPAYPQRSYRSRTLWEEWYVGQ